MMIKTKRYNWAVLLIVTLPGIVNAQIDTAFQKNILPYNEFIALVGTQNLDYAAEKFKVRIAEANAEAARIFPDPELTIGAGDNGHRRMRMGYEFHSELAWTLELGGKRRARTNLAASETAVHRALLESYFRDLKADATLAYLNAMKRKSALDVLTDSYNKIKDIATADSIRHKLGQISEVDALQSRVEAHTTLNEVHQIESDWKAALVQLGRLLGRQNEDTLLVPSGNFLRFERNFELSKLLTEALDNRADLVAALKNKDVSENMLRLARANRAIDLGLTIGTTNTSVVANKVAPTPSVFGLAAGISIPLKFSNRNTGELTAARHERDQAEVLYRETVLQIQTEVTKAWYVYQAARKQVQRFDSGLLENVNKILEGKVYSYQRGETALLELLDAQRTYNDTRLGYYEALYNQAEALIELERASGIWDITF